MLLEDRIVKFAAQCVKTCALLPVKLVGSANFADQMFRSATSIAANYAEACEAESSKDFVHKLKIAMKELSETRVWLKLIGESEYIENAKLSDLIAESKELSRFCERGNDEEKDWGLKWQLAILVLATLSHWQHYTTILERSVSHFHRLISPISRTSWRRYNFQNSQN